MLNEGQQTSATAKKVKKKITAIIFPKQDKELNFFCVLSGANADVETLQAVLGREGRRAASDFLRIQAQK